MGVLRRRLDFLSYAHLCSAAFNFDGHAEHVGYRERRSSLKGLSIYVTIEGGPRPGVLFLPFARNTAINIQVSRDNIIIIGGGERV